MKHSLLLLLALVLPLCAYAKSETQLQREMQLKLSEAYSHCGAYYHIAAEALKAGKSEGIQGAKTMKKSSLTHAIAMATEHVGKRGAKKLSNKHFKAALDEMHLLGKTDTPKFKRVLQEYRTSCRTGIEKPHAFIDSVLSDYKKAKPVKRAKVQSRLPSSAEILKRGKRTTGVSNSRRCYKPNDTVAIPLNDVLLENNKICSEHHNGTCNSDQGWLSVEQYLVTLFPSRNLLSFSKSSSMTFSNGQPKQKTEISACLSAL